MSKTGKNLSVGRFVLVCDAYPLVMTADDPFGVYKLLKHKDAVPILWSRYTREQTLNIPNFFRATLFGHVNGRKDMKTLRVFLQNNVKELLSLPTILIDNHGPSLSSGGFDHHININEFGSYQQKVYDINKIEMDISNFVKEWYSGKIDPHLLSSASGKGKSSCMKWKD